MQSLLFKLYIFLNSFLNYGYFIDLLILYFNDMINHWLFRAFLKVFHFNQWVVDDLLYFILLLFFLFRDKAGVVFFFGGLEVQFVFICV